MLSLHREGCSSSLGTVIIMKVIPSDWKRGQRLLLIAQTTAHVCADQYSLADFSKIMPHCIHTSTVPIDHDNASAKVAKHTNRSRGGHSIGKHQQCQMDNSSKGKDSMNVRHMAHIESPLHWNHRSSSFYTGFQCFRDFTKSIPSDARLGLEKGWTKKGIRGYFPTVQPLVNLGSVVAVSVRGKTIHADISNAA